MIVLRRGHGRQLARVGSVVTCVALGWKAGLLGAPWTQLPVAHHHSCNCDDSTRGSNCIYSHGMIYFSQGRLQTAATIHTDTATGDLARSHPDANVQANAAGSGECDPSRLRNWHTAGPGRNFLGALFPGLYTSPGRYVARLSTIWVSVARLRGPRSCVAS